MPVIFRGRSEYNRNYKWNQSYRSASFEPRMNQTDSDAGLRSDQIGFTHEPRITTKKKVWHRDSQVQSCLIWWPSDSDSEDHRSQASDPPVLSKRDEGSPLIKAVRKKESEKKNKSTPVKNKKLRSQSLDGSYVRSSTKQPQKFESRESATKKQKNVESGKESMNTDQMKKVLGPSAGNTGRKSPEKGKPPLVKREFEQTSPKPQISLGTPTKSTKREKIEEKRRLSPKKSKQDAESISLQRKAGMHANKPSRISRARLSEYQRNFMAPKIVTKPSPVLSALDVVHTSSPAIPPHTGLKFQKKSEYVANYSVKDAPKSPSQSPNKSLSSPASPSMKTKVKDIQKPFHATQAKKKCKSEYAAQFEANKNFQVGQLREIAESNKQKHKGTHIDPDHATQVVSPYNKLWDVSSNGSGDTKEPSEAEEKDDATPEERWSQASQKGSDTATGEAELDKEAEIETDSLEGSESTIMKESVSRKLAWEENSEEESKDGPDSFEPDQSALEGRITTPRLQKLGGALRTHLDLTTPCKGGSLLISPVRASKSETTGSFVSSRNEDIKPLVAGSPTYDAQTLMAERPHPLVRSSPQAMPKSQTPEKQRPASAKEPLARERSTQKAKRCSSSSPKITRHTTSLASIRAPIRGALKSGEFQHCGPTGFVHTTPVSPLKLTDDDALSVASSLTSARASELLQKAKERKSFWSTR